MNVKSNISDRIYSNKNVCRIVNLRQQTLYIKNNVYPIDVYASIDQKTGADILVMIFDRAESTEVYEKWCNHELR